MVLKKGWIESIDHFLFWINRLTIESNRRLTCGLTSAPPHPAHSVPLVNLANHGYCPLLTSDPPMILVSVPEKIVLLLLTLTFSNHFLQRSIPALKGWRQMHCAFPWFSGLEQSGRFRRRLLSLRSLSAALVDTRVDACSFWASHSQMRAKSNIVAVFLNDTIVFRIQDVFLWHLKVH